MSCLHYNLSSESVISFIDHNQMIIVVDCDLKDIEKKVINMFIVTVKNRTHLQMLI